MGTLYGQIEADVAWVKVVRQELARDVLIPPEEVKNVMDGLKSNQGRPEHLLGEIFLPLSQATTEADVQTLAERLVQQARGGTPFPALAQQFSQSPTAAVGGDLGWVLEGDLEDELDRAVARLELNEISDPIRTSAGYHILVMRGRRAAGAPDPMMAVVTLSQINIPTAGGRAVPPAEVERLSSQITGTVRTCDQMTQLAKQAGGPGSGAIEALRVGSLPDAVRDAVVDLPVGQISPPIDITAARLFVMVCSKQEDSGIPSEEQITQRLENDRLENIARQKLRDLRRQAIVDIRI
jgi:peptidyl-prolyl cis-trans isomerase SurA